MEWILEHSGKLIGQRGFVILEQPMGRSLRGKALADLNAMCGMSEVKPCYTARADLDWIDYFHSREATLR
jgi:hypothetical protein